MEEESYLCKLDCSKGLKEVPFYPAVMNYYLETNY